ncbi:MAG: twitching motility protein PilT [Jatrophihabitans sp.]|nr:MAG: twitching motility protein PilT [Jatrophihabitans sp.]
MSALVLDAGAFVAVDRDERAVVARLRAAQRAGLELRSTGAVIAQVWRDPAGRQANLARLLRAVDVRPVDDQFGRRTGELLGQAGRGDVVDAGVVAVSVTGDRILTGDPGDIAPLVAASGRSVVVVAC